MTEIQNPKSKIQNSRRHWPLATDHWPLVPRAWRWAVLAVWVAGAFALLVAGFSRSLAPANPASSEPATVTVASGATAGQIGRELERAGLIRSGFSFRLASSAWGYHRRFQAGTYFLKPSMSAREIMEIIASGKTAKKQVTIPEGLTSREIAARLEASGICSAKDFLRAVENPPTDLNAPFLIRPRTSDHGASLEGFLFPDTYSFDLNVSAEEVVRRMVEQFLREIWEPYKKEIDALTIREIVTLASMIEREAQVDEERPIIAQVYLLRLKLGWRLQCDATIQFALGWWKPRLTYEDLNVDSPYNTYRHFGLPPGPICNPGKASIEAALRPAKTEYLFYVAVGNGRHHFSKTYAEHEAAQESKK